MSRQRAPQPGRFAAFVRVKAFTFSLVETVAGASAAASKTSGCAASCDGASSLRRVARCGGIMAWAETEVMANGRHALGALGSVDPG